jgi:hypothetical protein
MFARIICYVQPKKTTFAKFSVFARDAATDALAWMIIIYE